MIYLYSGLPGHSKTLNAVAEVDTKYRQCPKAQMRPVYYLNLTDVTLDWLPLKSELEIPDLPKGSVVVIDECQKCYPVGKAGQPPPHIEYLAEHRHDGLDIYLISQNPANFNHFVRRLVERHIHIIRPYGLQFAWHYIWRTGVGDLFDKSSAHRVGKRFPKKYYGTYKSAEVHTHKKTIPWKLVIAFCIPLAFVLSIANWVMSASFFDKEETPTQELSESFQRVISQQTQATEKLTEAVSSLQNWQQQFEPVNPEQPFSAPFYQPLLRPVSAPRITGCGYIKINETIDCKCNTQQGTAVKVSQDFCMDWVATGGQFDFTRPDPVDDLPAAESKPAAVSTAPDPIAAIGSVF